jgi:hypothetical protein
VSKRGNSGAFHQSQLPSVDIVAARVGMSEMVMPWMTRTLARACELPATQKIQPGA